MPSWHGQGQVCLYLFVGEARQDLRWAHLPNCTSCNRSCWTPCGVLWGGCWTTHVHLVQNVLNLRLSFANRALEMSISISSLWLEDWYRRKKRTQWSVLRVWRTVCSGCVQRDLTFVECWGKRRTNRKLTSWKSLVRETDSCSDSLIKQPAKELPN